MNQQKPTLIFDYGAVLLEWEPRLLFRKMFAGDEAAMEQFMLEIDFNEWNRELDRGLPYAQGVIERSVRFPQYADYIKAFDERWEETINGPIQPVVDLLYRLKEKGYELHGLSNWSPEKFKLMRTKYAFFDLFESMVISGDVNLIKPDPRIYALLLEQIKRQPKECIFIDDSLPNIFSAKALDFQTIHYQSPKQLNDELASKGIYI